MTQLPSPTALDEIDHSSDPTSWISAADTAAANGDFVRAADLLVACSNKFPDLVELYELQAVLFAQLKDFNSAEKSLHKALEYKPNDANIFNQLGTIFYLKGDLPSSRLAYRTAMTLDQYLPNIEENLAKVEDELGLIKPVQPVQPFVNALQALSEGDYNTWKERNRLVSLLKLLVDPSLQNMPQWVNFQNSCICNLRCPHCQTHGTPEEREKYNARTYDMPDDLFLKAARETLPWVRTYALTLNGEPLATPHLEDVLDNFGKFNAKLDITTNGTLLSKERLIKIIPYLDRICVSIDGATEKTCEALRLGANFKKLIRNIRLLTRTFDLLGMKGFDVSMAMTVMASNIKDMPLMIRLAHDLGVKTVLGYLLIVIPGNQTEAEDVRLYKPLYNAYYSRARQLAQELGVRMEFPLPFDGVDPDPEMYVDRSRLLIPTLDEHFYDDLPSTDRLIDMNEIDSAAGEIAHEAGKRLALAQSKSMGVGENGMFSTDYLAELFYTYKQQLEGLVKAKSEKINFCDFLHRRVYIRADGIVNPCCVPGVPEMGNLNENSMRSIWNGEAYNHFRQQFFSDTPHPSCKTCGFKQKVPVYVYLNELAQAQRKLSANLLDPGIAQATTRGLPPEADPDLALLNNILKNASPNSTVKQLFGDVSDEYWYWLNSRGVKKSPSLVHILPRLPEDAIQLRFTGASGETTLSHGFNIYKTIKRLAAEYLDAPMKTILDFGCGWGRVIRFFVKDVEPNGLFGIDATREVLDICKESIQGNFSVVDPFPPANLPENHFDVIYAYSVYSHLAEEIHRKWLVEFHRLLRPGGLLVLTTRARSFILLCEQFRKDNKADEFWKNGPMRSFLDTNQVLEAYDRGDFVYEPAGGGGVLVPSIFGETCISRKYVESNWTDLFELVEYIDNPKMDVQNFIVVRKPKG